MIQKAREDGIVRISIDHPLARFREAEEKLCNIYGLEETIVVPARETEEETLSEVCRSAADYLSDQIPAPRSVAVSWGRTVAQVSSFLPDRWTEGVTIYQTNGGPSYTKVPIVADSLQLMANKGRGIGRFLPVPALVEDPKVAQGLKRDHVIASILKGASMVDFLCFSVGAIDNSSVLVRSGYLSQQDLDALVDMGACADVLCHFIDASGKAASEELDECTIGISLDAIKRIKKRMLIASGNQKTIPVSAVLAGGYASVAVIDSEMAQALIDRHEELGGIRPRASSD